MSIADEAREELQDEFLRVAKERLDKINVLWVTLENDHQDGEAAAQLLRELHTLKGESRMMEMMTINGLVHRVEELTLAFKRRGFDVPRPASDLFLVACDTLASLIRGENTNVDGLLVELSHGLQEMAAEDLAQRAAAAKDECAQPAPAARCSGSEPVGDGAGSAADPGLHAPPLDSTARPEPAERFMRVDSELVSSFAEAASEVIVSFTRFEVVVGELRGARAGLTAALSLLATTPDGDERARLTAYEEKRAAAVSSLEDLQHRLGEAFSSLRDRVDEGMAQSRELDFRARRLRLVTVRSVLERFVRPTRDLAHEHAKEVRVDIDDNGVTVDRSIAERLAEPLLHLIRNAVDHGIESAKERETAGKPATGRILLRAERLGGSLLLTIEDDGRGIDWQAIRSRAVQLGMVGEEASRRLTDEETHGLIFSPGYSTKVTASETSGRGVGLDVVKKTIEVLGGTVGVHSELHKRTRFALKVDVDVSLTRVLVLECGEARYALPAASVAAIRQLSAGDAQEVGGRQTVRFKGMQVCLGSVAAITTSTAEDGEAVAVFVEHGGTHAAVATGNAPSEHDVLIRPLGPLFSSARLAAGACTLEDGRLALVLSVAEVVARIVGGLQRVASTPVAAAPESRHSCVLLVEDSAITRAMVARILALFGHQVEEAVDGVQALAMLASKRVDMVVTDIDMPNMDGIELSRRIRQNAACKDLPIIVLSTRGSNEDKSRALMAGADSYLVKSEFSEDALRAALAYRTTKKQRH